MDSKKQETSNNKDTANLGMSFVSGSIKQLSLEMSNDIIEYLKLLEHTTLLLESTLMILSPAIFTVNSYWGSRKLTHLGTTEKIPLCGSKLQVAELTDIKIRINKYNEVFEFWD